MAHVPLSEPGKNTLHQLPLVPEQVFDAKPQEDLMIAFFCLRQEQNMSCNRLPLSIRLYCLIILINLGFQVSMVSMTSLSCVSSIFLVFFCF